MNREELRTAIINKISRLIDGVRAINMPMTPPPEEITADIIMELVDQYKKEE